MNYEEAMSYLHSTYKFGSKLGLQRIKKLEAIMGNPHKNLKYVHIAGTNGKGSTASFMYSILKEAGLKVGLFTSPHITRFNERIKVNDKEITNDEIASLLTSIREKIETSDFSNEGHPTEFEIITAMAFKYYEQQQCDIVVLEVGLGGSMDSTNIIESALVSIITTISYDHMNILGNTLEEIAAQKAGIIKQNGNVVVYPQKEEVIKVIQDVCKIKNANLFNVSLKDISEISSSLKGQVFNFENLNKLKILMLGKHQMVNASVAVKAVTVLNKQGFNINENSIRNGLLHASWPGRLEIISENPLFLLDGAHNIQGANNLAHNLSDIFENKKFIFIVGVLKDKEYEDIILKFIPLASTFITITPKTTPRGLPAKELANFIKKHHQNVKAANTVKDAIEMAAADVGDNIICAFGSLYYIGEVRDYFNLK